MKKAWLQNPLLWVSLILIYICVHFSLRPAFIHSFPEFSQVTLLLKNNPPLTDTFGPVQNMDFDDTNNEVTWGAKGIFGKGSYTGTYQFKVVGAKRSGVILVHWKSTAEHQARIASIDEVASTGGYLSTIWKDSLEQASDNPLPAESLPAGGQGASRVTVIDVCIYFFAGILAISVAGTLVYMFFWEKFEGKSQDGHK